MYLSLKSYRLHIANTYLKKIFLFQVICKEYHVAIKLKYSTIKRDGIDFHETKSLWNTVSWKSAYFQVFLLFLWNGFFYNVLLQPWLKRRSIRPRIIEYRKKPVRFQTLLRKRNQPAAGLNSRQNVFFEWLLCITSSSK